MQNTNTLNTTTDFMKAAFDAQNSRTIVFSALKDSNDYVCDFIFGLVGRGTADFFGYDPTGKKVSEVLPEAGYQIQLLKNVYTTGITNTWQYTYESEGAPVWFEVTDAKSGDCIVRVWQNITERRKAEEEISLLHASRAEEKYLSIFNAIDLGFCIIEMVFNENDIPVDYIFSNYNHAFEKLTGLPGARGKTAREMVPNLESHWFELYGEIAKTGKPKQFEQGSEEMLDGVWYEVSAFPISAERTNFVGIIFNDITARKRTQQELTAFNSRLEQEVQERTAKLNSVNSLLAQKNDELDKSNKELESFTYIASHDLQEPLRKIQTFLTLIRQRPENHAAVDEYMSKIFTATQRMSSLISDVLTYSRLNAERNPVRTDLNAILANVFADYELAISEKSAYIQTDTLPVIDAIPPQMHQLFSNLVSNALKYSSEHPEITVKSNIVYQGERQMAEITFSDNGIGFDDQYSDQIFKLFKRLHGRSEYVGTGIGLSICKKIVEQHGGSISAKSSYGHGAAFTILLPV